MSSRGQRVVAPAGTGSRLAEDARAASVKLLSYCRANEWAGHDPYDALNSALFTSLPFVNRRIPRLILTQALKRSPINIRRCLLVPKTQNAKAMALFLSAALKLSRVGTPGAADLVRTATERVIALRSPGVPSWCWGYSFPWQTRGAIVPRGAPNLVCTSFVANALLDAYEETQVSRYLSMAVSAVEYIVRDLYWTDGCRVAGFSYPLPSVRVQTHNANLIGAALLARIYKHTGDERFAGPALRVARYSAARQREDGSWDYGEGATQRWIDNFHTGYNLDALRTLGRCLGTTEFDACLASGFEFYRAHFLREDGAPRYFHDRTYPIDIHCVAQTILTLSKLRDLEPGSEAGAYAVFRWAMRHMWDERGFFYYRVLRLGTIRTSYMRWSQAWMLLALAELASESGTAAESTATRRSEVVA